MIGKIVKLIFWRTETDPPLVKSERMWVIVDKDLGNDNYEGVLDNDPMDLRSVKFGDRVRFKKDEIIDISDVSVDQLKKQDPNTEIPLEKREYNSQYIFCHSNHIDYDRLEKISVTVDQDWDEDFLKEELVVEEISHRKYRLKCVPLCVKKLSYDDIITFDKANIFEYSIERSEYISFLILVKLGSPEIFNNLKQSLIIEQLTENGFSISYLKINQKKLVTLLSELNIESKYTYTKKSS